MSRFYRKDCLDNNKQHHLYKTVRKMEYQLLCARGDVLRARKDLRRQLEATLEWHNLLQSSDLTANTQLHITNKRTELESSTRALVEQFGQLLAMVSDLMNTNHPSGALCCQIRSLTSPIKVREAYDENMIPKRGRTFTDILFSPGFTI